MKKNEKDTSQGSPLSYKLIIRDHKASEKKGEPDLILRKQPDNLDTRFTMETAQPDDQAAKQKESNLAPDAGADDASSPATASSVADYMSSLQHHVPDDVDRVVDAIIAEEGKAPNNLPRLDDQLTMIYPGSDVQELPGDDLFYERGEEPPAKKKTSSYTNKVEYEDL